MSEAPSLSEDEYAEFYEIDEPVIQFADRVNLFAARTVKYG